MLQAAGAGIMVIALGAPRIKPLRPYAGKIVLTLLAVYIIAATALIIWRVVAGPIPFMD
jgi:hypothetical protein